MHRRSHPEDHRFTLENTVSSWRAGWTVGAGLDVMVANQTSIGFSYNYIDYGAVHEASIGAAVNTEDDEGLGAIVEQDISAQQHLVKLNVNYHL